jgi:hypothetical protein
VAGRADRGSAKPLDPDGSPDRYSHRPRPFHLDPGRSERDHAVVCQVVIACYFPSRIFEQVYGLFYESSLVLAIFAGAAGMVASDDPIDRRHWANLQTGILGFMLPALAVSLLSPEPDGLLPSVMSHFAIVLAVSLYVVALRERRKRAVLA